MDNDKPLIKPIAYNYGLYLAGLSILILVIMYALNLDKSWIVSGISIVLTILIYVFGLSTYKTANSGLLSLGDAMKVGLAIAVISGVISATYAYFHYTFIYPEFIENIREEALNQMIESSSSLTSEQIDKASDINNLFTSPFALATFSLIGSLFFGAIISLIAGLIMKKEEG